MKPHCLFYAPPPEDERKVLPMPQTREQREREAERFDRLFFWGAVIFTLAVMGGLVWLSMRGGK